MTLSNQRERCEQHQPFYMAEARKKNMTEREINIDGRTFENINQWLDYLQQGVDENQRLLAIMQNRPLREGDKIDRRIELLDDVEYIVSMIIRSYGDMEVWMRRCVDEDDSDTSMTHVGFTLVAHFIVNRA